MLVLDRDATDHAAPDSETETTDPNTEEARASSEERAYWLCASLLEDALAGYFSPGLASLRDDLDALDADFRAVAPAAHRALDDMGCAVKFFCPRWLLCVMVGTAPTAVTLRVWDAVLVDSDRRPRDVLRRCALAALEARAGAMAAAPGMGEAVDEIRSAGAAVEDVQAFLRRVRDAPTRDAAARARREAEAARTADPETHARARPEADFRASTRAHARSETSSPCFSPRRGNVTARRERRERRERRRRDDFSGAARDPSPSTKTPSPSTATSRVGTPTPRAWNSYPRRGRSWRRRWRRVEPRVSAGPVAGSRRRRGGRGRRPARISPPPRKPWA